LRDVDDVADVQLSGPADGELRALVDQQLRVIREQLEQLERLGDGEDVCWLCLDPGQDEPVEIATMTLARAADRTAALADVDLDDGWPEAWNPVWCREEDEILLPQPATPATPAALLAALEDRVLDPKRWIAMRVARYLNVDPPPVPATDDFVVFVLNDEFGDDLIDELRFVAPPETYTLLRERGLIGDPEYR
jgi:hypothetical protein